MSDGILNVQVLRSVAGCKLCRDFGLLLLLLCACAGLGWCTLTEHRRAVMMVSCAPAPLV